MKKRLIVPVAVATLALAGIVPSASAATTAPSDTAAASVSAKACKSLKALSNLKVRKKPSTSSAGLRLWYKGTKGCDISGTTGGTYKNYCGIDKYNGWRKVNYRGTVGYVPNVCVVYS